MGSSDSHDVRRNPMRIALILLIVVLAFVPIEVGSAKRAPKVDPGTLGAEISGNARWIFSGHHLRLDVNGKELTVMILGIWSPPFHVNKSYFALGREFLNAHIKGRNVRVVFDGTPRTDKLDRVKGYVYLGDELINETLIRKGFAFVHPDDLFAKRNDFVKAQVQAIAARNGIWKDLDAPGPGEEFLPHNKYVAYVQLQGDRLAGRMRFIGISAPRVSCVQAVFDLAGGWKKVERASIEGEIKGTGDEITFSIPVPSGLDGSPNIVRPWRLTINHNRLYE